MPTLPRCRRRDDARGRDVENHFVKRAPAPGAEARGCPRARRRRPPPARPACRRGPRTRGCGRRRGRPPPPSEAPRATRRDRTAANTSVDEHGQGEVVEVSTIELGSARGPVRTAGNLGRVQPRAGPGAEDRMTEGGGRLLEDDLELEHIKVEHDEAVEVLGEDGDVVDPGEEVHRLLLFVHFARTHAASSTSSMASAAVSAASSPSMSQYCVSVCQVHAVVSSCTTATTRPAVVRMEPGRLVPDELRSRARRRPRRSTTGARRDPHRDQELAHHRARVRRSRGTPAAPAPPRSLRHTAGHRRTRSAGWPSGTGPRATPHGSGSTGRWSAQGRRPWSPTR